MTDEVVARLYRALVEELQRRDHPEERPVTVAELYQTLIPYRAVRSAIGVELNADYEHALLRLLAGEGDLLRLEPLGAREELRREVDAPYPFVGLFRKFSASDVWVKISDAATETGAPAEIAPPAATEAPAAAEASAAADAPAAAGGPAPAEGPAAAEAPARMGPWAYPRDREAETGSPRIAAETDTVRIRSGGGAEPAPERVPIQLHPEAETGSPDQPLHSPEACAFCGDDLPVGRRVRFCPHCGGDQRLRPCPRCEAVLERDWRHCISCGQEVGSS